MKYNTILVTFLILDVSKLLASENSSDELVGLPQLNFATFPEQIFWFLIVFLLLYLFIVRYVTPKIKSIQTSRERIINQNNSYSKKNLLEVDKIKKIIYLQLKEAQEDSRNNLKKITQDLLQIEEKRTNYVKINNDKVKESKQKYVKQLSEEFFKNYNSSLKSIINIILTKLSINISQEIIDKEIYNTLLNKGKKNG